MNENEKICGFERIEGFNDEYDSVSESDTEEYGEFTNVMSSNEIISFSGKQLLAFNLWFGKRQS